MQPDDIKIKHTNTSSGPAFRRQENSVCELELKKYIAKFLSATMWNPVPETWTQAIDSGFSTTCPGLTSKLIKIACKNE